MVNNLPANSGDMALILGREDPLEKEMATTPYSCLRNSMDRGSWWAKVHVGHKE